MTTLLITNSEDLKKIAFAYVHTGSSFKFVATEDDEEVQLIVTADKNGEFKCDLPPTVRDGFASYQMRVIAYDDCGDMVYCVNVVIPQSDEPVDVWDLVGIRQ